MMKLRDFQYALPERLIAQKPAEDRTGSRLMVLDRGTGGIRHGWFRELGDYLEPGDCLVFNDTKVMPARLLGRKAVAAPAPAAAVEALLIKAAGDGLWEAMVRPGKRLKAGSAILFDDGRLRADVLEVLPSGNRILRFDRSGEALARALAEIGRIPIPPYIREDGVDTERYQTVYARYSGSVAAPTAGLHFTEAMIADLERAGIRTAYLTLHVGPGTFLPVQTEDIERHKMHREHYRVSPETARTVNETAGAVVPVGTTSLRTLESVSDSRGRIRAGEGWTDIFIRPGYAFRRAGALLTNFHLPGSTLLMLVCAFAGYDLTMAAYRQAVAMEYRFFSFGDAMLIR
jgi:S-adenosylmethionine:tRNA ribosyltransferase-isomerase